MNRLNHYNRYQQVDKDGSFSLSTADGNSYVLFTRTRTNYIATVVRDYEEQFKVKLPQDITVVQMVHKLEAVWDILEAERVSIA